MSLKEFCHNKWVRFSFWAVLYSLWVLWIRNWWWFFGLIIVFDLFITRKVHWAFWKKRYKEGEKKVAWREWFEALVFAVILVTFINIFFIQAFKIPSSSMESSLYTGDHLFVSKLSYGPRLPQIPLSTPFVHNAYPISHRESYSTAIKFGYRRIKGFSSLKRDDCVVFNFPHGDTVLKRIPAADYYSLVRLEGREQVIRQYGPVVVRPVTKKDHYVKRCVAIAGDTLEVVDGQVVVNGVPQKAHPGIQMTYCVETAGSPINRKVLENIGLNLSELRYDAAHHCYPEMALTAAGLERIKALPNVLAVTRNIDVYPPDWPDSPELLFPFTETGWTRDNYGPLWIPAKGATVALTAGNLPLYRRIIEVYEGHRLEISEEGEIRIDGAPATEYTFAMDYYWMMGDNRHNSLDSRYWGFVPEDHVVGRPLFVWLSTDASRSFPKSIRWNRFLKGCK